MSASSEVLRPPDLVYSFSVMSDSVHNKGTLGKPKRRTSWRLSIFANSAQASGMAGNNIAAIRKAKGLSQTQLAEMVNTTLSNLGKLERGNRRLNQTWLDRIAKALGVEPYELIGPFGDEPEEESSWLPSDETLAFLVESIMPLFSGGVASSPERFELAGLAIGSAIRALSRHPHHEGDPGAMDMLRDRIAELIEREGLGSTR